MSNFYAPQINTIFLMMGNACNFQCRYCLQHPLIHEPLKTEISPVLLKFLLNMANKNIYPLRLQFYGGEPLLYWPSIVEIVESLGAEASKFAFSTITNGKLLTTERVKWLNDHCFHVSISWDGSHTAETRRQNVMDDPEIRENFLNLKQAGISAVISSKAYPWELTEACSELYRAYAERHGYGLGVNYDEIMDTGLDCKDLLDLDYQRVSREMAQLCQEYEKKLHNQNHNPVAAMIVESLIQRMKNGIAKDCQFSKCCCSNGYSVLNVDMQGNLYHCHNGTDRYGTVEGGFWPLLNEVMKWDRTREFNAVCRECPVQSICANGCPLIGPKVREASYCKLKRTAYYPVIDFVMQLGTPIEAAKEE